MAVDFRAQIEKKMGRDVKRLKLAPTNQNHSFLVKPQEFSSQANHFPWLSQLSILKYPIFRMLFFFSVVPKWVE